MPLRAVLQTLFVIGVLNFVACMAVALMIGGDALNGGVEDGRYYLSNHGRLTEVSAGLYSYSLVHTVSVLITSAIAVASAGALHLMDWLKQRALHRSIDATLADMRRSR